MEEEYVQKLRLTYQETIDIIDSKSKRYEELILQNDIPALTNIYRKVKHDLINLKDLVNERKERGVYYIRNDLGIEIASLEMSDVELNMFFNNEEEVNKIYQ